MILYRFVKVFAFIVNIGESQCAKLALNIACAVVRADGRAKGEVWGRLQAIETPPFSFSASPVRANMTMFSLNVCVLSAERAKGAEVSEHEVFDYLLIDSQLFRFFSHELSQLP